MDSLFKFTKKASPELQNAINTSIIFNYIRNNKVISRIKISKDLKLSAAAVSRIVNTLISKDYVIETEKFKTKKGKWPILLKVNDEKSSVMGIDLGKERFKIAFANINCKILEEHTGFKIFNETKILEKIKKEINDFLNKLKRKNYFKRKPEIIYIGMPAVVDRDGKIISAPLYNKWKNLNFKKFLEDEFNIPIFIENDVNLSCLGEKNYGGGIGFKDTIFIEISNGIGAGIIINNKLIRGSNGSSGEIGYSVGSIENLVFKKKDKGFLEKFASVEGLKKAAIKEIINGKKTKIVNMVAGNIKKINSNIIFNAAVKKDELANSLVKKMIDLISIEIIDLILILDPQILFIGGDVSMLQNVEELFLKPIINKVNEFIPFKIPKILLSTLGKNAGIVGACHMAIETLISSKFPYKAEIT